MNDVAEALRQLIEGEDAHTPAQAVARLSPKAACTILPGLPYSIATNVVHTDIWNRFWLARLRGEPKFNPFPDFPVVIPKDWPAVRDAFLLNLGAAFEISSAEPFVHHCQSDDAARKLLLKIAVHSSYHLGQIVLLKRALRKLNDSPT